MTKYYQGDTIGFYIQGNDVVNLDTDEFKIAIYTKSVEPIIILKADMTFISANKYYTEIENSETKDFQTGVYTMEILIGETNVSIGKDEAFTLLESKIGKL